MILIVVNLTACYYLLEIIALICAERWHNEGGLSAKYRIFGIFRSEISRIKAGRVMGEQ